MLDSDEDGHQRLHHALGTLGRVIAVGQCVEVVAPRHADSDALDHLIDERFLLAFGARPQVQIGRVISFSTVGRLISVRLSMATCCSTLGADR